MERIFESIHDKYLFKCIFLAGGPGSGKSFLNSSMTDVFLPSNMLKAYNNVTKEDGTEESKKELVSRLFKKYGTPTYSISNENIITLNSDDIYEILLKKNNVTNKIVSDPNDPLFAVQQGIRKKAKALTDMRKRSFINGMLPLVIDGTGKDLVKTLNMIRELENIGYDVYMIFVDVDLETTLQRNRMRSRSLSDDMVTDIWTQCQRNIDKYQTYFGDKFHIIDNAKDMIDGKGPFELEEYKKRLRKLGKSIFASPLENPIGVETLQKLRAEKRSYLK